MPIVFLCLDDLLKIFSVKKIFWKASGDKCPPKDKAPEGLRRTFEGTLCMEVLKVHLKVFNGENTFRKSSIERTPFESLLLRGDLPKFFYNTEFPKNFEGKYTFRSSALEKKSHQFFLCVEVHLKIFSIKETFWKSSVDKCHPKVSCRAAEGFRQFENFLRNIYV